MKKVFTSIVAVVLAASVFFTGCSDLTSTGATSSALGYSSSYGTLGSEVFAALKTAFGDADSARSILNGETTIDVETSVEESNLSELLENGYVTETAASYIERIDSAIDNGDNLSDIASAISLIEDEALANLSSEDSDTVLTYAETSKAALAYFDSVDSDFSDRSAWSKFKKKAKKVVKAAASGAVVGAVTGAIANGVQGAVAGAVTGAVISAVEEAVS